MYLPTTKKELQKTGWKKFDIILVTGDSYIDSPFIGVSVIGKYLSKKGFKVGIIAQPDINSEKDISRLGEPELFWGVSGGCVDSLVANYTASKKRRKQDLDTGRPVRRNHRMDPRDEDARGLRAEGGKAKRDGGHGLIERDPIALRASREVKP